MAAANDMIDTPARSALAIDTADVKDMIEGAGQDEGGDETEELRYVAFTLPFHLLRLQNLMWE